MDGQWSDDGHTVVGLSLVVIYSHLWSFVVRVQETKGEHPFALQSMTTMVIQWSNINVN
jgi:hypothetical protein